MALMDSSYYPERLGRMIIINAPSMFSWAWRIFQGFLNDVQRSKITIHGSDPEEWKPVLLTYIAADQIPLEYGGEYYISSFFSVSYLSVFSVGLHRTVMSLYH